ncbi:MAG: glycosyltransferase family 4 protein [Thermoplasmatales archaeon]
MRILRLNSISGVVGGVENYIDNSNFLLKKMGHEVLTITLTTNEKNTDSREQIFIKFTPSLVKRMLTDPIPSYDLLSRLNYFYNEFGPDIIHVHHYRIAFSTISHFILSKKIPVVFTAHDAMAVCPLSTLVKPGNVICEGGVSLRCNFTGCQIHSHLPYEIMVSRNFRRLANSKIKALICPSYSIMNYLISNGFSPTVHLPSFSFFDSRVLSNEPDFHEILSKKNIGFIGRLEWYKGIDDLMKGFAIFVRKHPEFNLLIAGKGPYENSLKRLAITLKISNKVVWLGEINSEQKEEFYRQIICNVIPSKYWENFPLSAQESLLRSIPTIGTRIGGIPEIIQESETGLLVNISSPEEIAQNLELIVENKNNNIMDIMKNGRKFVMRHLSPEKNINGLLDIYDKVLRGIYIPNGYDENPTII